MTNLDQIYSELKGFADDNVEYDEDDEKFSKRVENTMGKRRNCSLRASSSFSYSVFKRLVQQTVKSRAYLGKDQSNNQRTPDVELSFGMQKFLKVAKSFSSCQPVQGRYLSHIYICRKSLFHRP